MFWLGYFLFNVLRWGSYFNDYWYSIKSNLVEFPIHIIFVYINIYYLIPKFILRKKYWTYIMSLVAMLALVYLVRTGLNYLLVTKDIWPEADSPAQFMVVNHIIAVVLGELYVIGFVTAIKLVIDWSIERRRNEELAKLQLSTELKYLRTQIQPHFFFNTLNNLYALTLKKSDNAPRLVIKLSDMMQYILYDVNSTKANLLEEIIHINNYIDLERLRFENRVDAEVDITGDIEDVDVPPLLFLSFVENCFKHGMKGTDKLEIKINFTILPTHYLEFTISNTFNPEISLKTNNGIGNENAKRRLNLLFSNNYVLETQIEENTYNLFLKIPIK
ncbi:sensor histidine kinase [Polaribacter sp. MED152]|uniref:sensor histidine kinase n=1 Tax=Polaribacter sp. MED152 TaxID=313598 RepID=UPI000068C678|nr:histidine kinase [Polaribacter sp. MED152]EAQ42742.1 two-component system sensor histidine kinase [Polaribacter sp. MED152]